MVSVTSIATGLRAPTKGPNYASEHNREWIGYSCKGVDPSSLLERKSVRIPVGSKKMKLEWSKYSYGPMRRTVAAAGAAGRHA